MSSNVAPPQDDRGFWQRVADAEYGAAQGPGVNPNVFFGGIGGWQTGAGSRFDPTKEVGYFRFDTGNPTRDAILSIAANELGVDNFVRAVQKMDERNYWGAAGETVLAAASLIAFGALPVMGALSRGHQLYKIARATRAANVPGVAVSRGGPSVFTSALSPAARATGQWGFSTPINIAPTSPPSFASRLGAAVGANRRTPVPAAPAGSGFGTRLARLGRVAGRRIAPLALLGTPAWLYGASRSDAAPTAAEAAETAAAAAQNVTGAPPAVPRTIRDVDPIVGDALTEAGNDARNDAAGINRQYDNILRELRGMYQLSETNEERERLRFMLADIEAQREAGLEAIAQGYAQTVAAIEQRAEISRQQTAERAERFGSQLNEYADQAAQRMMLQNVQQQQQFRGLGSGSQTPVNEWVGLMSAMAPLQQQYTQRMGDITSEGIDWLASTVGAQGQAQSADLQRLAAATRSASIMSHQRQIADRTQRERDALRGSILQLERDRMNALGQVGANILDPFDRQRLIEAYALGDGYGPGYIGNVLRQAGQGALTPAELAQIEMLNQRHLALDPTNAANRPVTPDRD